MQNLTRAERLGWRVPAVPERQKPARRGFYFFPLSASVISEMRIPPNVFIGRRPKANEENRSSQLPALIEKSPLVERKQPEQFPVTIREIRLEKRKVLVDSRVIEIPLGAGPKITVKALKKLASAYIGSVVLAKTQSGAWTRLRDSDVIEVPKSGSLLLKSLPSFQLE